MSERFILAIDQGTTSTTVLLFDRDGRVRGRASTELTQRYPHPGWVEQDADEIWRTTLKRRLVSSASRSSASGTSAR